jgi:hypothetical protein
MALGFVRIDVIRFPNIEHDRESDFPARIDPSLRPKGGDFHDRLLAPNIERLGPRRGVEEQQCNAKH